MVMRPPEKCTHMRGHESNELRSSCQKGLVALQRRQRPERDVRRANDGHWQPGQCTTREQDQTEADAAECIGESHSALCVSLMFSGNRSLGSLFDLFPDLTHGLRGKELSDRDGLTIDLGVTDWSEKPLN